MRTGFMRLFGLVALLGGFVGVAACLAGVAFVWSLAARLERANDRVFDAVDAGLAKAGERMLDAQRRVHASRITVEEVGQTLKDWTTRKIGESLASRLEVGDKAAQAARGLRQVDGWLETSSAVLLGLQQTLDLGEATGAAADTTMLQNALDKLASLQGIVRQACETADDIHEFTAKVNAGEDRLTRARKAAVRLVATCTEIDTRLGDFASQVGEARTSARQLRADTSDRITLGKIALSILLVWMAAGQAALCRYGFIKLRAADPT